MGNAECKRQLIRSGITRLAFVQAVRTRGRITMIHCLHKCEHIRTYEARLAACPTRFRAIALPVWATELGGNGKDSVRCAHSARGMHLCMCCVRSPCTAAGVITVVPWSESGAASRNIFLCYLCIYHAC